jgi:hypothetical protein
MTASINSVAPHDLHWIVVPPGGTDDLYIIATITVIVATVLFGVLFFWLHSLPDRLGRRAVRANGW